MNWDDPAARAALIQSVGPSTYNQLAEEHFERSTVATVNGHRIRAQNSRWGVIYFVWDTQDPKAGVGFQDLEKSKAYARSLPEGTHR